MTINQQNKGHSIAYDDDLSRGELMSLENISREMLARKIVIHRLASHFKNESE